MPAEDWEIDCVINDLADGWGVEEVAERNCMTANRVRDVVEELRADGTLELLYRADE